MKKIEQTGRVNAESIAAGRKTSPEAKDMQGDRDVFDTVGNLIGMIKTTLEDGKEKETFYSREKRAGGEGFAWCKTGELTIEEKFTGPNGEERRVVGFLKEIENNRGTVTGVHHFRRIEEKKGGDWEPLPRTEMDMDAGL